MCLVNAIMHFNIHKGFMQENIQTLGKIHVCTQNSDKHSDCLKGSMKITENCTEL